MAKHKLWRYKLGNYRSIGYGGVSLRRRTHRRKV